MMSARSKPNKPVFVNRVVDAPHLGCKKCWTCHCFKTEFRNDASETSNRKRATHKCEKKCTDYLTCPSAFLDGHPEEKQRRATLLAEYKAQVQAAKDEEQKEKDTEKENKKLEKEEKIKDKEAAKALAAAHKFPVTNWSTIANMDMDIPKPQLLARMIEETKHSLDSITPAKRRKREQMQSEAAIASFSQSLFGSTASNYQQALKERLQDGTQRNTTTTTTRSNAATDANAESDDECAFRVIDLTDEDLEEKYNYLQQQLEMRKRRNRALSDIFESEHWWTILAIYAADIDNPDFFTQEIHARLETAHSDLERYHNKIAQQPSSPSENNL